MLPVITILSGITLILSFSQDKERAMNYITKDMPTFAGKKRYWVSQSLARPIKATNVVEKD